MRFGNVTVSAEADALAELLDAGHLRIYGGEQPETVDTGLTSQPLLAELRFADPSAPAAINGVLVFNPIAPDPSAFATGTAVWFRAFRADGVIPVLDGRVGTDAIINTDAITVGTQVQCNSFTIAISKG